MTIEMAKMESAKKLITSGQLREAGEMLDELISKNHENEELWYFRGIVSLKLKNYSSAQESFSRAVLLKKKVKYFRMMGIGHMEIYELDDAIESFKLALLSDENDVTSLFFISVCYMFFDNPMAISYIKKAYGIDKKKTKQLLNNFYSSFFGAGSIDEETKNKILDALKKI